MSGLQANEIKNGFDLSDSIIKADKILSGGPAKDGIPAINIPKFLSAKEAGNQIKNTDKILGVAMDGIARAYPIAILNWHEIVNDKINTTYFSVTYCPLCGSGVVFKNGTKKRIFGVSGLLYNNDVLLYDETTNSLWSQILSEAISGKLKGQKLTRYPAIHTDWQSWIKMHPNSQLLSQDTGFARNYQKNPYSGYNQNKSIYFPVENINKEYHPKERVLGIQVGDIFKAYPYIEVFKNKKSLIDEVGDKKIKINFDQKSMSVWASDMDNNTMVTISSYWFAWMSFYPDSLVYKYKKND